MQIDSLRSFIALVQYGSYTDAAKALYISQPTLSKRIAALEKELQAQLFFDEKPLLLTEAGRLLMTYACSVIAQTDTLELQMKRLRGSKPELIRIQEFSFFKHFAERASEVKQAIRDEYPTITFETVRCKTHQTPVDALLARDLDVGVQMNIVSSPFDAPKPTCAGYVVQPFYGSVGELRLGVPNKSTMAAENNLRLRDFEDKRFVTMADRRYESLFDDFRQLCLSEGFLPKIEYITTSNPRDFWLTDYDDGVLILDAVKDREFTEVDEFLFAEYKPIRPMGHDKTFYIMPSMITRDERHGEALQKFIDIVARIEKRNLEIKRAEHAAKQQ